MPFEHEASCLRRVARDRRTTIWWTDHADEEREKDGIFKTDVTNMLCRCTVSLVETDAKTGDLKWRAEGKDIDDRVITATVVVDEANWEITIITTWAAK